ncbi:MAG: Mth938-like domain-containing protein [Candidatus Heimdallarchaeota archaeon]|nr:Mth938-like domain-containing protein [Candidatus Heimdallarchaeota archaeon]MDH5645732.1 Mth938-like domain-containing protein [Candidatus Heimdallarchaeota archaeon]
MYKIDYYQKGEIIIGGNSYHNDVIILPNKIISNWKRQSYTILTINDLQLIIPERPCFLIVGSGYSGSIPIPEDTQNRLRSLGFELFVGTNRNAMHKYNENFEKKKTIAIFLFTQS